jgi:hypothetical protein
MNVRERSHSRFESFKKRGEDKRQIISITCSSGWEQTKSEIEEERIAAERAESERSSNNMRIDRMVIPGWHREVRIVSAISYVVPFLRRHPG